MPPIRLWDLRTGRVMELLWLLRGSCAADFCKSWSDGQRVRRAQGYAVSKIGGADVRLVDH